jgi:hypothetical protein
MRLSNVRQFTSGAFYRQAQSFRLPENRFRHSLKLFNERFQGFRFRKLDHVAWRSVIRVNSDGRPSRSAKPGQSPVPLFT